MTKVGAPPPFDAQQGPINWQELEQFLQAIGRRTGPLVLALFPPDPSKPCIHFPCDAGAMPRQEIEAKQRSKPELALGLVMNHALPKPADWGSKPEHLNKVGSPKAWGASDSHISRAIGIWGECDGGLSIEEQQALPGMAGLPEPTLTVWTGGKSLHLYWLLEPGELLEPGQFRELQQRLAEALAKASPAAGADRNIHNPARLMRVPGGIHPATGNRCSIHGGSGKRFTLAALLAMLPAPEPAPCPLPGLQQQARLQDAHPLHELLPKELERLALEGADKGGGHGRNNSAFRLAASAWAIAPAAAAAGLRIDGSPESLVLDFAARCRPPLEKREAMACIESARGRNPTPDAGWPERLRFHLNRAHQRPKPTLPMNGEAFIPADGPSNGAAPWGQGDTPAEQPAGKQRQQKAKPQGFTPRADTAVHWGERHMGHNKRMQCMDRCIEVQARIERNSLRRRVRLLKAVHDLKLQRYYKAQDIGAKILEAKAAATGNTYKPLTAADRAAMEKPVLRWALPGLIPATDLTIIGGRPKVGKTRLAVAVAAAVLRGENLFDLPAPSERRKVVLVTDDQSDADTEQMLSAAGIWNHDDLIWSQSFRLTETNIDALLRTIEANPGALVVIDSLRSIGRDMQHGENDPEIGAVLYDLKQAVMDAGGTLLLIHHCNKAMDLVGVEALSGHNAISGAANTVLTMHYLPNAQNQPNKGIPERRLVREGRSGSEMDIVITRAGSSFRKVGGMDEWQQQAQRAQKLEKLTAKQQDVLDALEGSGEWLTRRQMCELLKLPWGSKGQSPEAKQVAKALTRLMELKAVESANEGAACTYRFTCGAQKSRDLGDPPVTAMDLTDPQKGGSEGSEGSSTVRPGNADPPDPQQPAHKGILETEGHNGRIPQIPKIPAVGHADSQPVLLPLPAAPVGSGADVLDSDGDDPAWGKRPEAA